MRYDCVRSLLSWVLTENMEPCLVGKAVNLEEI